VRGDGAWSKSPFVGAAARNFFQEREQLNHFEAMSLEIFAPFRRRFSSSASAIESAEKLFGETNFH
jgi:hypothetical protein